MGYKDTFWGKVERSSSRPPRRGQCCHVFPSGSRCGNPVSEAHGGGEWCYSHAADLGDGRRGRPVKPGTRHDEDVIRKAMEKEYREVNAKVARKKDERVLKHLTDAAQAISPCPDDGSAFPPYVELASDFRARNKRWPLWWEMAKLIHEWER